MTIYATLRRHGTGDILRMVVTCVNFNLLVLFIRRKVNQFSHEKPHLFQRVDEQPILFGTVWNCLELFGTWNLELFGTVWNLELFGTWNCLELFGTVWNCLELFGTVCNLDRPANTFGTGGVRESPAKKFLVKGDKVNEKKKLKK